MTQDRIQAWAQIAEIILMLVQAGPAAGDSLRCDNRLVSVGQTGQQVRQVCGEPQRVETWEQGANAYVKRFYDYEQDRYQAPRVTRGPIRYEAWTYDFGPQRFIRTLTFEEGRLIRIEAGDKGSAQPR